jgi:hypothetical protein
MIVNGIRVITEAEAKAATRRAWRRFVLAKKYPWAIARLAVANLALIAINIYGLVWLWHRIFAR